MKEKAPHMPWYGRDHYADENVMVMSLEQEAAYQRLLWLCWQEGSIPDDMAKLAAIAKNMAPRKFERTIWPALAPCFVRTADGRLTNRKVEELRDAKNKYQVERSESGKRGNEKRWGRDRVPDAEPSKTPSLSDHEPIAERSSSDHEAIPERSNGDRENIPVTVTVDYQLANIKHTHTNAPVCVSSKPPRAADLEGQPSQRFEEFWGRYPRKQRKDAAGMAWVSVVTVENEEAVFGCLQRYLASGEVARGAIANADKWLFEQSKDRWEGDWPRAMTAQDHKQAEIDKSWDYGGPDPPVLAECSSEVANGTR